ncbi:MAG: hypothetical protein P4K93_17150 [Terracidiphilus sp.]|nr:hypothetical protein [Terracidiphilus sp.]MDR3799880.1 hypothetical protein [Terracidiphilus sp.]
MSIFAIQANSNYDLFSQSSFQKLEQELQQLGTDLQSGNLTAAQADYVTLQQDLPQTSDSYSQTSNPIEQAFNQLSKDLQAGNLTAAQQDFQTIQKDLQNQAAHGSQSDDATEGARHHHHHHGGSGSSESNQISKLMSQLGKDLQSGNLTSAQQDFTSLQSLFAKFSQSSSQQSSTSSESATSTFSVNA